MGLQQIRVHVDSETRNFLTTLAPTGGAECRLDSQVHIYPSEMNAGCRVNQLICILTLMQPSLTSQFWLAKAVDLTALRTEGFNLKIERCNAKLCKWVEGGYGECLYVQNDFVLAPLRIGVVQNYCRRVKWQRRTRCRVFIWSRPKKNSGDLRWHQVQLWLLFKLNPPLRLVANPRFGTVVPFLPLTPILLVHLEEHKLKGW